MQLHNSIRAAMTADFGFIHSIAARPENAAYIEDVPDQELAEYCAAPDMNLMIWENNSTPAGFALFCEIGNPSGRVELRRLGLAKTGKGTGQAFIRALIDHAFDELQATRLWLDVVQDNPRAHAIYHRSGFTHEGTLRQNWRRPDGEVVDMLVFGMLRAERP